MLCTALPNLCTQENPFAPCLGGQLQSTDKTAGLLLRHNISQTSPGGWVLHRISKANNFPDGRFGSEIVTTFCQSGDHAAALIDDPGM